MLHFSFRFFILLFFLAGCDDNGSGSLIRDYEEDWRLDYTEPFEAPDTEFFVAGKKALSDGSLLLVISRNGLNFPSTGLFVLKISPAGEIVDSITLPEEYGLRSLYEVPDGYLLTFRVDESSSSHIQYRIDASLSVREKSFTFDEPSDFHALHFTPAGILQVEYEDLGGVRIKCYTYEGAPVWDKVYNEPALRPFPRADGNALYFFINPEEEDTVIIQCIDQSDGSMKWSETFTSQQLFEEEGIWLGTSFILNGVVCVTNYELEQRRYDLATINPLNGKVSSIKQTTIELPSGIYSYSLSALTRDGGCIFHAGADGLSLLHKTDAAGNVGWVGQFVGLASPVEAASGDLYVVTEHFVIKLRPVR